MGVASVLIRYFKDSKGNKAILRLSRDADIGHLEVNVGTYVSERVLMPMVYRRPVAIVQAGDRSTPGWHSVSSSPHSGGIDARLTVNNTNVGQLRGRPGEFRLSLDGREISRSHQNDMRKDWESSIGSVQSELAHIGSGVPRQNTQRAVNDMQEAINESFAGPNAGAMELREVTAAEFARP